MRRTAITIVGSALALVACTPGALRPPPPVQPSRIFNMPDRPVCEHAIGAPVEVGTVESALLTEASGAVASPRHQGVLWMHNDHGDHPARVFAVSTAGKDLGQLVLPGVDNHDFEDIAAAPCPDLAGACIYVADTGNNLLDRTDVVVYAFPEPDVDPDHPLAAGAQADAVWKFPITMGEPVDVEAFIVLPDVSAMIFYEKASPSARVFKYAAPWTPDTLATLELSSTFTSPGSTFSGLNLVTGADVHPSGTRVALRTYGGAFEIKLDASRGVTADRFADADVVQLFQGPASEPQGEAIAYDEDGTGLFLVSESPDQTPHQPLHHAPCE